MFTLKNEISLKSKLLETNTNNSLHLQVHVMLQSLDVLGVVALDPLQHGLDLGLHAFHLGLQGVRSARIFMVIFN